MKAALQQTVLIVMLAYLGFSTAYAEPHHHHEHSEPADKMAAKPADAGKAWAAADTKLKAKFTQDFNAAKDIRPVFEKYLGKLSVRAMLDFLELRDPLCHGEAHELGKALFASNKDLGLSLMQCGNGCTNACMHGVVGEAFGNREYLDVINEMTSFCSKGEMARLHKPGNCAHGMGHALMLLTKHDLEKSLEGCAHFAMPGMDYYCATGVFMEYSDDLDNKRVQDKIVKRPTLNYPCDTFTQYPAACYRYMLGKIAEEAALDGTQLVNACLNLEGKQQLGCFHGLGALYLDQVNEDPALLGRLCQQGDSDDQIMCIEGAIEKLADFDEQRAINVCNALEGDNKSICLSAAHEKMYRLDKASMHLYR